MLRKIFIAFIFFCSSIFTLQAQELQAQEFKAGDLLFQDLKCGPLCDAIDAVTKGYQGKDFSHVGIVVNYQNQLGVIEAIGSKVQFTSLNIFLGRSFDATGKPLVVAARLKKKYAQSIEKACELAIASLGTPYDDRFLPNNDSLYCSELIYAVFLDAAKEKPLFKCQPMTYKQPGSEAFFPAWIDYYAQLHSAIPEGKMGLNPGLISRSGKIKIIYQYGTWLQ
jgi:hypothetical protein